MHEVEMTSRIEFNSEVCNGKPVIRGTRIPVATILGYLTAGDEISDVLESHPTVTREDVLACLDYARALSETHSTVESLT